MPSEDVQLRLTHSYKQRHTTSPPLLTVKAALRRSQQLVPRKRLVPPSDPSLRNSHALLYPTTCRRDPPYVSSTCARPDTARRHWACTLLAPKQKFRTRKDPSRTPNPPTGLPHRTPTFYRFAPDFWRCGPGIHPFWGPSHPLPSGWAPTVEHDVCRWIARRA